MRALTAPAPSTAIYTAEVIVPVCRIDWREFLDRPPLPSPSPEILEAYRRQSILITGAGGSIGSSLALRLARLPLSSLILLDSSESHLLRLQESLSGQQEGNSESVQFVLADAGHTVALKHIFETHQPSIVFHAAAYKHVPLLERQPFAAIVNNVFVAETVATIAAEHRARVVLLSTDKAVQPSSILGATKNVAEKIARRSQGTVLRLANVLASSGSVAERFRAQIARGDPLTVTHAAARRYFLTTDESVDLLLITAQIGRGGVFAPNLPTDYSIAELAKFMIRILVPGAELSIEFSGLRPGDKLTEQLWEDFESTSRAGSGLLSISSDRPGHAGFEHGLAELRTAVRERDLQAALAQLCALVPGYCLSQTVQALAASPVRPVHA